MLLAQSVRVIEVGGRDARQLVLAYRARLHLQVEFILGYQKKWGKLLQTLWLKYMTAIAIFSHASHTLTTWP